MLKPKKQKLTKEQIAQQMRVMEDVKRAKDTARAIFPALQKFKSPIEAQSACEIIATVMNSNMSAHWMDKPVSDLNLIDQLTGEEDVKDRDAYVDILEKINDMKIPDAQKFLQGMGGALDGYVRLLAKDKLMVDVKVEEIVND